MTTHAAVCSIVRLLVVVVASLALGSVFAFVPQQPTPLSSGSSSRDGGSCGRLSPSRHVLRMGKGFNGAKSKQAELLKKMQRAKEQSGGSDGNDNGTAEQSLQTAEERKLEEDRARFSQLLREITVSNPNPDESDANTNGSLGGRAAATKMKGRVAALRTPKEKGNKKRKKTRASKETDKRKAAEIDVDAPLREGDTARRRDFEPLIDCASGSALGPMNAAGLVPWVPPFLQDCMVVLVDPRAQSGDLRRAIQYLTSTLSPGTLDQTIAISADEVTKTRSWSKRAEIETPVRMFSDRNWEWMRRYSAVADDGGRWSMSIIVIDNSGVLRRVVRDVDPAEAGRLVTDAVDAVTE